MSSIHPTTIALCARTRSGTHRSLNGVRFLPRDEEQLPVNCFSNKDAIAWPSITRNKSWQKSQSHHEWARDLPDRLEHSPPLSRCASIVDNGPLLHLNQGRLCARCRRTCSNDGSSRRGCRLTIRLTHQWYPPVHQGRRLCRCSRRGTATFANVSDASGEFLSTFTPAYDVNYFRELADLCAQGRSNPEENLSLMLRHATVPADG
jgi:hypothetical protein